jgi:hypothetical protein
VRILLRQGGLRLIGVGLFRGVAVRHPLCRKCGSRFSTGSDSKQEPSRNDSYGGEDRRSFARHMKWAGPSPPPVRVIPGVSRGRPAHACRSVYSLRRPVRPQADRRTGWQGFCSGSRRSTVHRRSRPTFATAGPNWSLGDVIPLGDRAIGKRDDDADQPPVLIVEHEE